MRYGEKVFFLGKRVGVIFIYIYKYLIYIFL